MIVYYMPYSKFGVLFRELEIAELYLGVKV